MRARVPVFALAALLLCAHSACRRPANDRNIAMVDSLLQVTDSLIAGVTALDMDAMARIDSAYSLKKDQVQARMRDTLTKDQALLLGNYHRTMTKSLGRAKRDHGAALAALSTAREQLTDLRTDLRKGLWEPALETKHINDERLALARSRHTCETVMASVEHVLRDEDHNGPAVDSLLAPAIPPSR